MTITHIAIRAVAEILKEIPGLLFIKIKSF